MKEGGVVTWRRREEGRRRDGRMEGRGRMEKNGLVAGMASGTRSMGSGEGGGLLTLNPSRAVSLHIPLSSNLIVPAGHLPPPLPPSSSSSAFFRPSVGSSYLKPVASRLL